MKHLQTAVLVAFVGLVASEWTPPRQLGSFKLEHAGFVEVFDFAEEAENYADKYTLYISTFNYCKHFMF